MSLSRKSIIAIIFSVLFAVAVVSVAAITFIRFSLSTGLFSADVELGTWKNNRIYLNIENPDAIIISERLFSLPKDILNVPLLKDTLTESFVFYYEDHPGKSLLTGTLKRLAYEKELTFNEKLIQSVFDTPSEVYLWRGPNGQLDYWALSMEHHTLARALEGLSKMVLSDVQLAKIGEIKMDGKKVPLYGLRLSSKRAFLFASHKDRLLVLSHPEILLKEKEAQLMQGEQKDGENASWDHNYGDPSIWKESPPAFYNMEIIEDRAAVLSTLLSSKTGTRTILKKNLLVPYSFTSQTGHDVYVNANYLSFSYQPFFPAIEGLHFQFDKNSWQSRILIDPAKLSSRPEQLKSLWQNVPTSPAACSALPLDWGSIQQLAEKMSSEKLAPEKLTQEVAVCWYGKSSLAAPLFVARFEDAQSAQEKIEPLSAAFAEVIGSNESRNKNKRFPAKTEKIADDIIKITRVVSTDHGTHESRDFKDKDKLSSNRYFPVTLAIAGPNVFFSPDSDLVDDAVAVYQNRLPSLADTLMEPEKTRATITPKNLVFLFKKEAWQSLPKHGASVLREVTKNHLEPRLKVVAGYPPVELIVPEMPDERQWVPLEMVFNKKQGK